MRGRAGALAAGRRRAANARAVAHTGRELPAPACSACATAACAGRWSAAQTGRPTAATARRGSVRWCRRAASAPPRVLRRRAATRSCCAASSASARWPSVARLAVLSAGRPPRERDPAPVRVRRARGRRRRRPDRRQPRRPLARSGRRRRPGPRLARGQHDPCGLLVLDRGLPGARADPGELPPPQRGRAAAGCARTRASTPSSRRAPPVAGSPPAATRRMWRRLPATVRRVYVLRDVPRVNASTGACVSRTRGRTDTACTVPRGAAIIGDSSAQAAARAGGRVRPDRPHAPLLLTQPLLPGRRRRLRLQGRQPHERDLRHHARPVPAAAALERSRVAHSIETTVT